MQIGIYNCINNIAITCTSHRNPKKNLRQTIQVQLLTKEKNNSPSCTVRNFYQK